MRVPAGIRWPMPGHRGRHLKQRGPASSIGSRCPVADGGTMRMSLFAAAAGEQMTGPRDDPS